MHINIWVGFPLIIGVVHGVLLGALLWFLYKNSPDPFSSAGEALSYVLLLTYIGAVTVWALTQAIHFP